MSELKTRKIIGKLYDILRLLLIKVSMEITTLFYPRSWWFRVVDVSLDL